MKHCAREADRKERAWNSAVRALSNDCQRELSPKFISLLAERATDGQGKLFGHTFEAGALVLASNQVMEKQVLASLQRRENLGQDCSTAAVGAVQDALKERADAHLRSIKGHWIKHGGQGVEEPIKAAKTTMAALPLDQFAGQIISGKPNWKSLHKHGESKKVDLDENLLR